MVNPKLKSEALAKIAKKGSINPKTNKPYTNEDRAFARGYLEARRDAQAVYNVSFEKFVKQVNRPRTKEEKEKLAEVIRLGNEFKF